MKRFRINGQEDLFEKSRSRELQIRVKELDYLIAQAIKRSDFNQARELTEQQKSIIQELVAMGESEGED
jgi:hypothetical protein